MLKEMGKALNKENLNKVCDRVAEDKSGRYLPAKLIGAILKARGKRAVK